MSNRSLYGDIERVLYSEQQIQEKIAEWGKQNSEDYAGKTPVLVGILKGCAFVMADLVRIIDIPVMVDFIAVSSYGPAVRNSGVARILKDLDISIEGRHVLVVEDIIDTGLTLSYILRTLRGRHPESLSVGTLFDKPARRFIDIPLRYKGIELPDEFVVGYGLDHHSRYRNLPFLGILKPETVESTNHS
jgi:hypoxanthine phosphoribosyltransferase